MTRARLLITRKLPDSVEQRAVRDYDATLNPDDHPYDGEALIRAAADQDALLITPTDKLSAALIERLPDGIRVVATFSIGTDHIDLDAARKRGLTITNTPGVLTDATADCALLLMLGAARRAFEGEQLVRTRRWSGWTPTQLIGADLGGKRLGIFGMGQIGRAVANRARAFGMSIHYSNRRRLTPDLEGDAVFHADPEALLRVSDVLSLNAPGTPETRHFLNARTLNLLPHGAIVINTARGSLIDDEALIDALKSGRIRAAGLDVFDGEPRVHPGYLDLPNTFLLPHLGSATERTRIAMGNSALDNIGAVLAGRQPPAPVV